MSFQSWMGWTPDTGSKLNVNFHWTRISLSPTGWASISASVGLPLKDFWLNILARALFDLPVVRDRLLSLLLFSPFLASSSDIVLIALSKRRLYVGYLDIDLVIPWSLKKNIERYRVQIKYGMQVHYKKSTSKVIKYWLLHYLRANPSSSARLRSDSGGVPRSEFFNLSGLPLSRTNFPRYASSLGERCSALICSLMIRSGFRNQSKKASLGLFVGVISVALSAAQMW